MIGTDMNAWSVPGYTESRELGSGGSGRVVLAVHDATGVPVAVKYLGERLRADAGFLQRFRAEARLLSGLDSPYVVRLYEYVEAPQGAAIVMELVDGIALRALLRQEGPTGPEAALVVLKGSLLGLAAAHRAGVVHRDYKPENVLVALDGSSKLVDFGIATGRGSTPGVAGTPAYMAPEQWNGEPASPAADVYAATATFYECLTGRKPFSGENFAELALQHIGAPVPEEQAPEPVRPLIRRGLAKAPQERPRDADVFVAELEEIAGAAYGPDWEERGQRRLAALAALLPLLFPSGGGQAASTTALATTTLGDSAPGGGRGHGRSWKPGVRGALATAVALIIAAVAAVAAGAAGDSPGQTTAQAVTTAGPVEDPGATPGATPAGPSGSASPSPTGSVSTSGSPSASDSATTGTSTPPVAPPPPPSSPTPSTPTPSVKPSTTAPTTQPVQVKAISVTGLRQTGTASATGTVEIVTDGTGPITVAVTWFTGEAYGQLGAQDGSETIRREGATQYSIPLDHTFQQQGCYWGMQAATDPAAANGAASQQILTRRCTIS